MENIEEKKPAGELLVYQGQGIDSPIHVRLEGDTVWLSQKQLAELYGTSVPNINQHISGIYEDEELRPEATIKKYSIVQTDGLRQVKRLVDHYNLDMIIVKRMPDANRTFVTCPVTNSNQVEFVTNPVTFPAHWHPHRSSGTGDIRE